MKNREVMLKKVLSWILRNKWNGKIFYKINSMESISEIFLAMVGNKYVFYFWNIYKVRS